MEEVRQDVAQSKYQMRRQKANANADANVENVNNDVNETTKVNRKGRDLGFNIPEHIVNIAYIVKDNAAIRRFTALNIINYLKQTGKIEQDSTGNFVNFYWNKFCITSNGLKTEYSYKETFFLNCLVASFSQFAKNAQDAISIFIDTEGLNVNITGSIDAE